MEPLAFKIRPTNLHNFVGQEHLVGDNGPIKVAIEQRKLFSFILWGPPGSGKTTLGRIYATSLGANFIELSAVSAGKDEIRQIVANQTLAPTVLFLDEIHRFNKAQQDFLLPYVESGKLTLIGATTENPSFEVIPALLSRVKVFVLKSLSDGEMQKILNRADIAIPEDALKEIINFSDGDARLAIGALETTYELYSEITVDNLHKALQEKRIKYSRDGEDHYNLISAFIKSMRSSQADAALYYLGRMIEAGEDPKFIARRMVIFASEDIGLEDPYALMIANDVFRAVEIIGLPEASINLSHGVLYLCSRPKSKKVYESMLRAYEDAKKYGNLPVPMNIRNAPTKLMKDLGYGKGYEKYTKEDLLPEKLKGKKYFF